MIGEVFAFHQPASLTEAAGLLRAFAGEVTVLGGGTMLIPSMSANQVRWKHVVGLSRLHLDAITLGATHVCIGAMTTYAQVLASPVVAEHLPLLRLMADQVTGGPSIWNQGTLGGSASFANPASDAPACLAMLEATFVLHAVDGIRRVAAQDYFLGAFHTARRSDELLTHIEIPLTRGPAVWRYQKYKSSASSWPIVTVACAVQLGEPANLRVAVGAAAPTPVVVSRSLPGPGREGADAWIDAIVAEVAMRVGDGWTDELAEASYRRAVVPAAVRRNLRAVIEE
ncbi:FAD binding domain-containing protein [Cupriavidus plantarum]|uniref:FAD binding domain-containing protein n=1 Tax=Cupriavidus plantarum TaxID=942865 RepID=UPI0015CD4934|nr:FAD binding domain-containing protein [Cupriavidus plantarum]NYI02769.1 carbon-monoxide dehydrogenase medium subunit [Cupriavidus plantarum]